jgi:cytidylate kinase
MSRKDLVIAIDGPAASGKSTTARLVAQRLGYTYIDTGAMYRAVTLAVLRAGIDPNDRAAVERLAADLSIHLDRLPDHTLRVMLDGEDISAPIRTQEVTAIVSIISAYQGVRKRMVELQKKMAECGGVVMDGRDIGTVVFPEADVKVFMVADLDARAQRRQAEFQKMGTEVSVNHLASSLAERDRLDTTREVSPLTKSPDAIEIDTSRLTVEEQVERVIELAESRMREA